MTKHICKGLCMRYEKAPPGGVNVCYTTIRLHPYRDLNEKRCTECDYNYYEKDWLQFRNPVYCNCCGMKMRVRSAHLNPKEEFVRY